MTWDPIVKGRAAGPVPPVLVDYAAAAGFSWSDARRRLARFPAPTLLLRVMRRQSRKSRAAKGPSGQHGDNRARRDPSS